jgi:hypothetical protein
MRIMRKILTFEIVLRRAVRVELVALLLLYDDVGQVQIENNTVRTYVRMGIWRGRALFGFVQVTRAETESKLSKLNRDKSG